VNQCLVKVTDLLKMVNNKLLKNKNSITAIVLNYIKENKLKARNESLKLYDTIKFDEQRNREISSVLTKYHNKIIEPGINMIINFI
jgi:dihydroxyacetone kinase-like predicted kinase